MKPGILFVLMLTILLSAGSVFSQELELELALSASTLLPGSRFSLDLEVINLGPAMPDSVLFIALTIGTGDFWFYPSWVHYPSEIDWDEIDIEAATSDTWQIIPEFAWPAGVGAFSGAMFLGAVVYEGELASNIAETSFGWVEMPQSYQPITCNSDWIEGIITDQSEPAGFSFEGTEGSTYYIWWDDSSSGSGTCTADVSVSAFYQDKSAAYFRDAADGFSAPKSLIIAPGQTSVYIVLVAANDSVGSFRVGVTFFPWSPEKSANARQAAAWMTGDFDSFNQSQQNPAYLNITLRMKWIWPERTDGYWLYVEQAVAGSNPYRQRVYKVGVATQSRIASEVYEFLNVSDEQNAVGAWADENPLSDLGPDDFVARDGCIVFLTRTDPVTFTGGTDGKDCASSMYGATYATSDVTLTAEQLTSWDRGFNANDEQVWGAVAGPYIFDKKQNFDSDLDL